MSGNIRDILHIATILLKCENMFAMLMLCALILHSDDNIEIAISQPYCMAAYNLAFLFQ